MYMRMQAELDALRDKYRTGTFLPYGRPDALAEKAAQRVGREQAHAYSERVQRAQSARRRALPPTLPRRYHGGTPASANEGAHSSSAVQALNTRFETRSVA